MNGPRGRTIPGGGVYNTFDTGDREKLLFCAAFHLTCVYYARELVRAGGFDRLTALRTRVLR